MIFLMTAWSNILRKYKRSLAIFDRLAPATTWSLRNCCNSISVISTTGREPSFPSIKQYWMSSFDVRPVRGPIPVPGREVIARDFRERGVGVRQPVRAGGLSEGGIRGLS